MSIHMKSWYVEIIFAGGVPLLLYTIRLSEGGASEVDDEDALSRSPEQVKTLSHSVSSESSLSFNSS